MQTFIVCKQDVCCFNFVIESLKVQLKNGSTSPLWTVSSKEKCESRHYVGRDLQHTRAKDGTAYDFEDD